jgi:hypothetical protein
MTPYERRKLRAANRENFAAGMLAIFCIVSVAVAVLGSL